MNSGPQVYLPSRGFLAGASGASSTDFLFPKGWVWPPWSVTWSASYIYSIQPSLQGRIRLLV